MFGRHFRRPVPCLLLFLARTQAIAVMFWLSLAVRSPEMRPSEALFVRAVRSAAPRGNRPRLSLKPSGCSDRAANGVARSAFSLWGTAVADYRGRA